MRKAKAAPKVAKVVAQKTEMKESPKSKQGLDPLEARRRVMVRWAKPGAREEHAAKIRAHLVAKHKQTAQEAVERALAAEARERELEKEVRALRRKRAA